MRLAVLALVVSACASTPPPPTTRDRGADDLTAHCETACRHYAREPTSHAGDAEIQTTAHAGGMPARGDRQREIDARLADGIDRCSRRCERATDPASRACVMNAATAADIDSCVR